MRRRLLMIAWVLVANGVAAYYAIYGSSDVRTLRSYLVTPDALGPTWRDYLRGVIPVAGMLFEVLGLKIAKYFNIGYFAVLSIVWGAICIYNWRNLHTLYAYSAFVLSLVALGVDLLLYRKRPS